MLGWSRKVSNLKLSPFILLRGFCIPFITCVRKIAKSYY